MKNVLITGCSQGLGEGLATHFLSEGYNVYAVSRSVPKMLMEDDRFFFRSLDLTHSEKISSVVKSLIFGVEKFDYVILNAGILGDIKLLKHTSLKEAKEIMDVNVWGNKVFLDALIESNVEISQVVAISSGASINGNKGWGGYSVSKAALNMLIKLYAAENEDIHFTSLAPGLIDTDMQDYLCDEVDTDMFPSAIRLKEARNTSAMPKPLEAAQKIATSLEELKLFESGSYQDIRKI